jgi:uncharacterized protein with PIN domain
LTEIQLDGSGGWIKADLTDEQVTKSNTAKMSKHFCKQCNEEFEGPTKIQIEESPNEAVADGLILIERGQYTCHKCNSIIGEYRVFQKKEE